MREVVFPNSGMHFLFGNVSLRRVSAGEGGQTLEVLYAGREAQSIRYLGVRYSAFREDDQGLVINLAERLPIRALREDRHHAALMRMLKDGCRGYDAVLDEAEQAGCQLFLHYVGEREEYPVLARTVSIDGDLLQGK